jgi:xylulokinase
VPLVGGVDCSTQGTKVVVVDADTGRVVATGRAPHTVTGRNGERETDPRVWEDALARALAKTGRAGQLAAVSVAGQQHGLVVVDGAGTPLRPALLWNDTRSAVEAARVTAAAGGRKAIATRVGSVPTAAFTVAKWSWLRAHEPATAAAAVGVRLPHDHLTACLTGAATTDRSDVSGTGWWSPADEAYAEDVLGLGEVDLDPGLLPPVVGPADPAGAVSPAAAGRYGLVAGTPVGCGAGDNAAAGLALGLTDGEVAVSLGTSGTAFATSGRPSADPDGIVAGFAGADGRYLPLACTLNATLAVDRVAGWLGLDREAVAPSGGVTFLPWLDGERTPDLPAATGTLTGLRHDTEPEAILQAAYEGLVTTLLLAVRRVSAGDGPLLLIGGGARGRAWLETLRRLSGRPVVVPDGGELVARGAAVQAAALLDGRPPHEVATGWEARRGQAHGPLPADGATRRRVERWIAAVTDDAEHLQDLRDEERDS